MRWAGNLACMGNIRNAHNFSVGKSEGRLTWRWEYDIKMKLKEIGCEGFDWIHLAQGMDHWQAGLKMVMNFSVP
jgi:hypothetical protein